MRNISDLHPKLQEKAELLVKKCKEKGISIGISECLRTKAEQDALYAKGRTTAGAIVTNAKGSSYSSMHQWGVAFDFYLKEDVDGDGKTGDDAFNNSTKLFNKVGAVAKDIGLEWGGDWKMRDLPHVQLPNWGSTASKLKAAYETPDKFMKTWDKYKTKRTEEKTAKSETPASKNATEPAKSKASKYVKWYETTANVRLRAGAGTNKSIITTVPEGEKVQCYGYYTKAEAYTWLYVTYEKYAGFIRSDNLK